MVAKTLAIVLLCTPFQDPATALYGYKDCDGAVGLPATFTVAQDFSDQGIAAVLDGEGWAYIDRAGKMLLRPMPFDNGPDYFVEGLARFTEGGKIGFFDETGRVVFPARYDFAFPFDGGVAKVGDGCRRIPDGEHTTVECDRWSEIRR